jgi:hypothetical protein
MNLSEGEAEEHIKELKKKVASNTCIEICLIVFLLLILMTNFNEIIPKSTADSSSNAKCSIPVSANTNSSELKVNVLPPKIVMNYAGREYHGDLSEAKYRAGINFPELHIRPQNITKNVPLNIVHVKKGSCIQFLIRGTPKLLPPSSLAVTAYSAISGAAAKVLNATDYDNSIFRINLNSGNYILLATATWLPGKEDVTGYVIYKFAIRVA